MQDRYIATKAILKTNFAIPTVPESMCILPAETVDVSILSIQSTL
jgi:hypothetical protein